MTIEQQTLNPYEGRLLHLPPPPADTGAVVLVVARPDTDERLTPAHCRLTPEGGVEGDRWAHRSPEDTDNQITMMRADVARLLCNGHPLSEFGDNLMVELDLSETNLPPGTTLCVGTALCEVTPKPHRGCSKFNARFGNDALRLTAMYDHWRLRGLHLRVLEPGDVAPGDPIQILSRPTPPR